ncbi:30S ribosomal protein S9 [Candidatus Saccharibacteria bacterium HGW-Saccharibacteria-1]|jgi:small subunit ribosomal protein S9|nr:MAG: 30S ribosomal protein S9 [Candidatus Saccharibacteria bacterium HGW-Saccharibacteria-1]
MAESTYFYGLGRRKSATASARLYAGKGKITINDKPAAEYLSENKSFLAEITDPLALVNKQKDFDITILVKGGGAAGQVDAIKLAIAKAITIGFPDLRPVLKKAEFLKRDSREKERKKYGLRSARKREQFSKR